MNAAVDPRLCPDVLRPSAVREALAMLELRPRKALGQNFIVDRNAVAALLDAAEIASDDRVLEVGPGLGGVTFALIARGARVLAVEKDERLFAFLEQRSAALPGLRLVCADMLDLLKGPPRGSRARVLPDPEALSGYKLVANLPYAAGTRILVGLVQSGARPERIVVTVQREVAERLSAAPGTGAYGLLAVWLQRLYDVRIVRRVSPRCFLPEPAVTSAIVAMHRHSGHAVPDEKVFYRLTKLAFAQRRKQLAGVLARAKGRLRLSPGVTKAFLEERGLPVDARAERLGVTDWCELAGRLGRSRE